MGVDITYYLLVGVKLDYDVYAEKFQNHSEKITDFISQIGDCMSGEYFYLGHIISYVDEYDDPIKESYDGFKMTMKKYKNLFKKVAKEIKPFLNDGDNPEVDMFYIKHYS